MNPNITIETDRFRKWVGTLLPVVILIVTVTIAWANLGSDISTVSTALGQHVKADCIRQNEQDEDIADLKRDGTGLSHSNEKRIIKIEESVKYTEATVKRIEALVRELTNRPK
jgi:hypothetical protein